MVSSAILCLLCLARDVAAAEGPARSAPPTEGNVLYRERLLSSVQPSQDRAVVDVSTHSDADAADDGGVHVDLQRDLPTVEFGQPDSQGLLVGIGDRLGH